MAEKDPLSFPDFDVLPGKGDFRQGCAWGVFDKDGEKDRFGTLNFLTSTVVRSALKEAQEGISVSLNWPLDGIRSSGYGRKGLTRTPISFMDTPLKFLGFDDEVEFNTQCSSQWDSLIHFAHQSTNLYYNGFEVSIEDLQHTGSFEHLPTLDHWHARGGLVGRGVLIDYKRWADAHDLQFNTCDTHQITIKNIEKVAQWQKVEFCPGDILLIRSGYTEDLSDTDAEGQRRLLASGKCCGVENTVDAARWLWNKRFSAVAGDMVGFETCPPLRADGTEGDMTEYVLHPYLLAMFGMPIGELWDLARLSRVCVEKQKYSFLLTSVPLNSPGLVGSPPCALAIF